MPIRKNPDSLFNCCRQHHAEAADAYDAQIPQVKVGFVGYEEPLFSDNPASLFSLRRVELVDQGPEV